LCEVELTRDKRYSRFCSTNIRLDPDIARAEIAGAQLRAQSSFMPVLD